ncbi:hypothetical protein ACTD5D_39895 [Nocardia takedensis]|uniref:hypothetical protein n=1 Tax=Nocardia takedensis TaxID=259390 RepID=UPI003F758EDC
MAADNTGTGRGWWAPIGLGAALCLACCAAPILVAAGTIGGGALLVGLSWLEPLGFVLLAAGVTGLIWSRTRRADACGSADRDTDDAAAGCGAIGCGCATTASATSAGSGP